MPQVLRFSGGDALSTTIIKSEFMQLLFSIQDVFVHSELLFNASSIEEQNVVSKSIEAYIFHLRLHFR